MLRVLYLWFTYSASVCIDIYSTSCSSTPCNVFFVWFPHLHFMWFKYVYKLFNSVILVQLIIVRYATFSFIFNHLLFANFSSFSYSKNYTQVILLRDTQGTCPPFCCPFHISNRNHAIPSLSLNCNRIYTLLFLHPSSISLYGAKDFMVCIYTCIFNSLRRIIADGVKNCRFWIL
jgi:hypothetical protein